MSIHPNSLCRSSVTGGRGQGVRLRWRERKPRSSFSCERSDDEMRDETKSGETTTTPLFRRRTTRRETHMGKVVGRKYTVQEVVATQTCKHDSQIFTCKRVNIDQHGCHMQVHVQIWPAAQGYRHSVEANVSHSRQLTTANATERERATYPTSSQSQTPKSTSEKTHHGKF